MRWTPYQLEWLADRSPQKACCKARRIGLSEATGFEIACGAVGLDLVRGKRVAPVDENILSASHAQAKELLAKAETHVKALQLAATSPLIESEASAILRLSNGREIRALSSNPRTIRGYTGNLTWDEAAHTPKPKEVWAAAAPIAKPTLGRPQGFNTRILSSPNGDGNLFYEIIRGRLRESFSVHEIDVYRAVAQGFGLMVLKNNVWVRGTIDELREEIGDPDMFAQEYENNFLSASARYISAELWDDRAYHFEDMPDGPAFLYGGMDVARLRDASAIVRHELKGQTLWHRDTEAEKGMSWEEQEAWVDKQIDPCAQFAIDETGMGSMFAERLDNRFRGRVIRVTFSQQAKEMLATGGKLALERKRFHPRADDVELRRDVLMLRREVTAQGRLKFDAPRTKSGHADRAWACLLGIHASGVAAVDVGVPEVTTRADVQRREHERAGWGGLPRGGGWR